MYVKNGMGNNCVVLTANNLILLTVDGPDQQLMHEVTADIPRAVDQIFEELGVDVNGCISEDEW